MAKATKAQAAYHAGATIRHCGLCTMFRTPSECTVVAGQISPYGLCDKYYKARANPFPRAQVQAQNARLARGEGPGPNGPRPVPRRGKGPVRGGVLVLRRRAAAPAR